MDYEIFFPADKNVTKSNIYFQKFCKDFGDYKHFKTQIVTKKCMRNVFPKAEQYV